MRAEMISLKRFVKNRIATNITINWSEAITVEKFQEEQFSTKEQDIVNNEGVIYIFVGENQKGEKAIDVGQTSNSLLERTKQHLQNGDYLEGYSYNQMVYCGKVTANICVDRELLEQIEGIIIQHFVANVSKSGYYLCNDSKTNECKKSLVRHIVNRNMPNGLKRLLSWFIIIRKTKDEL